MNTHVSFYGQGQETATFMFTFHCLDSAVSHLTAGKLLVILQQYAKEKGKHEFIRWSGDILPLVLRHYMQSASETIDLDYEGV